jgi:hypothetical protein
VTSDAYDGNGNRPGHTSDDFYSYGADRYMLTPPATSHGGKRASRKNRRRASVKARRANRRVS